VEYDPIELIVSYASQPHSLALSAPTITCAPSTPSLSKELYESTETEVDCDAEWDDSKFRSCRSCSTLPIVAPAASSPRTPTTASARLRIHLDPVARLVRARRSGSCISSVNSGEGSATVSKAVSGSCPRRERIDPVESGL
jgi:hypothetical protein